MAQSNKLAIGLFFTALAATATSNAGIIAFDDKAAWQLAAGPLDGGEDFEGFAADTTFDGISIGLSSGMQIGTIGGHGRGIFNFVDVSPIALPETDVNGSAHANILGGPFGPSGLVTPFITFTSPVTAFGADIRSLNDDFGRTSVDLYGTSGLLATLEPGILGSDNFRFFGFASDAGETISEIRFRPNIADAYGIDNILISTSSSEVPLPATFALLGLGLFGLRLRCKV